MPRMRSIKPEMFRSFTVSGWPVPVRWTFAGLLTYLDDSGRGADDARLIRAELYPLDDDMTARKVEQHLSTISGSGPLCRYEAGGRRYLHVTSWAEHQRINRPTKSRVPPCPLHERSLNGSPPPPDKGSEAAPSTNDTGRERSRPRAQASAPAEHGAWSMEHGAREDEANASSRREREDVDRLCEHLATRIRGNGSRQPKVTKHWRDAARLMLDRDDRTETQVHAAIDWCQDDEFWRGNILSMPKLREKYDQLRLQARRVGGKNTPTVTHVDTWRAAKELDRRLADQGAGYAAELRDLLPDIGDA